MLEALPLTMYDCTLVHLRRLRQISAPSVLDEKCLALRWAVLLAGIFAPAPACRHPNDMQFLSKQRPLRRRMALTQHVINESAKRNTVLRVIAFLLRCRGC